MIALELANPFGAPVYYEETVSSTMDVSRVLSNRGEPGGTVIIADFQESGRGRGRNRSWNMERGKNLAFTVLLRFPDFSSIPRALTLRTGLAVSLGIEDFAPALAGAVEVKWPNDIMIRSSKAQAACKAQTACKIAGILTEAEGPLVHIGIGVNLGQREFPSGYRSKAGSIILALEDMGLPQGDYGENARFRLLEAILRRLHSEITGAPGDWKERLEKRLYKQGETVRFIEGPPESEKTVDGLLAGIGPAGELLIIPKGETMPRPCVTGELRVD
jgi:BirA family biotin operon repressor/biotin-[acetyl-CoA-carboxylase] ligase